MHDDDTQQERTDGGSGTPRVMPPVLEWRRDNFQGPMIDYWGARAGVFDLQVEVDQPEGHTFAKCWCRVVGPNIKKQWVPEAETTLAAKAECERVALDMATRLLKNMPKVVIALAGR
jgi:hypothetical protein